MGKWTKYFIDGTVYEGSDEAIRLQKASWRRSRNEGIIKVELENKPYRISIEGPGEYWQSDTYDIEMLDSDTPKMVRRRIQRRLTESDKFLEVVTAPAQYGIKVFSVFPEQPTERIIALPGYRTKEEVWLTVEVDLNKRLLRHFFSPRKI